MTAELHKPYNASVTSPVDVDAVVREVLRRFSSDRPLSGEVASPSLAPIAPAPQEAGNVTLSGRVITLDDVEGQLETATKLTVPTGAVVTPAVRDALKKHRVTMQYADENSPATRQPANILTVASTAGTYQAEHLAKALSGTGTIVEEIKTNDLANTVAQLVAVVTRDQRLGLLLTDKIALAACMANRDANVRAAVVDSLAEVALVTDSLGANVLIVDPQAVGLHTLRSIATTFVRRATGDCPAELSGFGTSAKGCACSSAK